MQRGTNEVPVTMMRRLAECVEERVLHQAELLIEYAVPSRTVGGQM